MHEITVKIADFEVDLIKDALREKVSEILVEVLKEFTDSLVGSGLKSGQQIDSLVGADQYRSYEDVDGDIWRYGADRDGDMGWFWTDSSGYQSYARAAGEAADCAPFKVL